MPEPSILLFNALNMLAEEVHASAIQKGFYDPPRSSFPEQLCLIHAEVSEALEDYRDGHGLTEVQHDRSGKPTGIPIELADVLIRVLDTARSHGIDIGNSVAVKMAYNKTREYRHGDKKL